VKTAFRSTPYFYLFLAVTRFLIYINPRRIKAVIAERVAAADFSDDFVSEFIEAGMYNAVSLSAKCTHEKYKFHCSFRKLPALLTPDTSST
jgi:hypothetical protein